jgi:hypothetical protein
MSSSSQVSPHSRSIRIQRRENRPGSSSGLSSRFGVELGFPSVGENFNGTISAAMVVRGQRGNMTTMEISEHDLPEMLDIIGMPGFS